MAGIKRITILDGLNSDLYRDRIETYAAAVPLVEKAYREALPGIKPGRIDYRVPITDELARKDYEQGTDLYLEMISGARFSVQEKILDYWEDTLTIEMVGKKGKPGQWYYCTAGLYMAAYVTTKPAPERPSGKAITGLRSWVLVNYTSLKLLHETGQVRFQEKANSDRRFGTFVYIRFQDIPPSCIVARSTTSPAYTLEAPRPQPRRNIDPVQLPLI